MQQLLELLDWTFYGNTVRAWAVAVAIFLAVATALRIARGVLVRRLEKVAARTATQLDDLVVDLARRTRVYFMLALGLLAGAMALVLPVQVYRGLRAVAIVATLLQLARWGNGAITFWIDGHARRSAADGHGATTIAAFAVLARIVLWVVILLTALGSLGVNITALLTGLGVGGIAVALAVQNILGDLFAAFSIVVDKPFVVGETIHVDTFIGTVENIGLKSTRLRALSGEQVIISNADLLKSRIRNYKRMRERRASFVLGLTYDTPAETMARVPVMLREIVEAQPDTRFDRSHFLTWSDSALQVETVYYVLSPDYTVYANTQQAINLEVLRRFAAERIQFAFPTRTMVVKHEA